MLSLKTGHDVGYLTGAVAGGRENYYTGAVDAGEPPGVWFGAGAERLGLSGEVDADLMEAIYAHLLDPRDPATHSRSTWAEAPALAAAHRTYKTPDEIYTGLLEAHPGASPERRAELRAQAERSARQAVSFIDATFSAPKSVTVLGVAFERAASEAAVAGEQDVAAAWSAHAQAVEDAVMAGARASIEYLQAEAGYSRIGHHGGGAGRWIDAHEFVVAQFLQHDSRDRDPNLHVHQAVLNRVPCADGEWRTLDSRAIHNLRGAAGAIGERVMEEHLARALGVRFETRPDGKAREVIGVPQEVMDLFSSRRRAVSKRTQELVDAYREQFGREPNALERTRLAQQATLLTRSAKSHEGETRAEQLDRWAAQLNAEVGTSLVDVAHGVFDRAQQADPPAAWSPQDVIDRALARVAQNGSSFSRSDLLRAISDELPAHLAAGPERVGDVLNALTDDALTGATRHATPADTTAWPDELLLQNGSSAFEGPGSARYSTDEQFHAEAALRAATVERGAHRFTDVQAAAVVESYAAAGRPLGVDQAAAVHGVLTSGARVEVLSAAPGTGKSFVVGTLAEAWTTPGPDGEPRRVFGLAPSQIAARVLTDEGVTAAANTTAWLGSQQRIDRGGTQDEAWRLRRGDLVVVDEANMAGTDQLAEIQQRCADAGAKLLLVGDPRQLTAVGPGGALADVAEHGLRYELAEVRRFSHEWERTAALRLHDADPAVLEEYAKHGRLRDGGTAEQAEHAAARAWLADALDGRESLLMVRDNATAARLSAHLRAELVDLGKVDDHGVPLARPGWEGVVAGVGDLVQARRNAWSLAGYEGNERAPINRDTFRVLAVRPDGGLTVAPVVGRATEESERVSAFGEALGTPMQLPASYVAQDVTLAYAATVHAAEGRTVDTAHAVVVGGTDAAGLLVSMTRGRDANTAWVVTTAVAPDTATGEAHDTPARTARAVLADVLENDRAERTATADRDAAELAQRSTMTHVDRLIDLAAQVTAGRTARTLDELAAEGTITAAERRALAADEAMGSLEQLLRTAELAGHDPDQVLRAAAEARSLDGATSPAKVLHHRITTTHAGRLTPHLDSATDLIPAGLEDGRRRDWLIERATDAELRRHELGAQVAADAPQWAVEALGPVPEHDPADESGETLTARLEWERRAGWAASWRELTGHEDADDALGRAPARGLMEKAALYRKAHEELGLLDVGAEEADMSDGRLRARVHAYEREKTWAPRTVADDLAVTHEQADRARTDATVWAARADAATGPDAEHLRAAAAEAERTAQELAERAAELENADDARAAWYVHTAVTRDNAHRAAAELRARGIDVDDTSDRVTAADWLDAHQAAEAEEDQHRDVHPDDVADDELLHNAQAAEQLDAAAPDIRDTSTPERTEDRDPVVRHRVPTVDETADAVARAQASLREIEARQAADAERAAAEAARQAEEQARADELAQWANTDTDTETADTSSEQEGPVLER